MKLGDTGVDRFGGEHLPKLAELLRGSEGALHAIEDAFGVVEEAAVNRLRAAAISWANSPSRTMSTGYRSDVVA